MSKRSPAPIVRHSYAPDSDPEKVRAALELWRQALARKLAQHDVPTQKKSFDQYRTIFNFEPY